MQKSQETQLAKLGNKWRRPYEKGLPYCNRHTHTPQECKAEGEGGRESEGERESEMSCKLLYYKK